MGTKPPKKNDLSLLFDAIKNGPKQSVWEHINAECVCCQKIFRRMIRVGTIFFCPSCYPFKSKDPVRQERGIYLNWLTISQNIERRREEGKCPYCGVGDVSSPPFAPGDICPACHKVI